MEELVEMLTIGQVARCTGVSVEAIRFYERETLIAAPPRNESGYRQYPPEVVRRIRFIKRAKDLGFTLKEILELLSLRAAPGVSCQDIRAQATAKITDIDEKIRMLEQMRIALGRLAAVCPGSGPVAECPILEALETEEEESPAAGIGRPECA